MFWKKEYQPIILGCKLNDEELQQFLVENDIGLQIVDNSTRWYAFAQCYALHHDFNVVKATSFSYMVSLFMTGMGISASTEAYIKEETVEKELLNTYNEINKQDITEETKVLKMFDAIVDLYTNRIHLFEYCSEWITFRLTPTERELFRKLPGKTAREKFQHLMNLASE